MAVYSFLWSFVLESKTRKKWSKSSLVGVDSRHKKLTHVDESELEINSRSGVEMLHHPFKTRFEIREKGWQPLSSSTFVTMATSWQCLHKNFAKHATRSFCHLYVQFIVIINLCTINTCYLSFTNVWHEYQTLEVNAYSIIIRLFLYWLVFSRFGSWEIFFCCRLFGGDVLMDLQNSIVWSLLHMYDLLAFCLPKGTCKN